MGRKNCLVWSDLLWSFQSQSWVLFSWSFLVYLFPLVCLHPRFYSIVPHRYFHHYQILILFKLDYLAIPICIWVQGLSTSNKLFSDAEWIRTLIRVYPWIWRCLCFQMKFMFWMIELCLCFLLIVPSHLFPLVCLQLLCWL